MFSYNLILETNFIIFDQNYWKKYQVLLCFQSLKETVAVTLSDPQYLINIVRRNFYFSRFKSVYFR